MSTPTAVLLARLANILESARLESFEAEAWKANLTIIEAQKLLDIVRDQV